MVQQASKPNICKYQPIEPNSTRDIWFCSFDQTLTNMPPRRSTAASTVAQKARRGRSATAGSTSSAAQVSKQERSVTVRSTTQDECVTWLLSIPITHNIPLRSGISISRYVPGHFVHACCQSASALCSDSMPDIISSKRAAKGGEASRCV